MKLYRLYFWPLFRGRGVATCYRFVEFLSQNPWVFSRNLLSFFLTLSFFAALSILYLLFIELWRFQPKMVQSRLVESFLAQARNAPTHWVFGGCLENATSSLSLGSCRENATGSLSFWAEIALSYWFGGVIFPLSFYKSGQKKSLY